MTESRKVVIAGFVRSPFTPANKGELKDVRADDLMAQTVQGLIAQTGVNPALIEDLKLGCAMPEGEQGLNLGRHVALQAGMGKVPALTINRFCGSSMQAIHDAAGAIAMGMADAVIAGGVESMSRVPMGGFNPSPNPKVYKEHPENYMGMGETAENLAAKYGITREEQDKFALASQFKAAAAKKAGEFASEIVPITTPKGKVVSEDGCPRPESKLEDLARLKPAFKADGGSVTPATSSPVTDGASAVLVCSEDFAIKNNLVILAEIESFAVSGCAPEIMGIGPVEATQKALAKAGLTLDQIDVIELNEAFAAQSLAVIKELGLEDDAAKINQNGGAIALGHPLGASGARITGEAAKILHDKGGEHALATMCIGGGQGIATVLKKYNGPKA